MKSFMAAKFEELFGEEFDKQPDIVKKVFVIAWNAGMESIQKQCEFLKEVTEE